ncbi:hypothetical protein KGF56_004386 [Candida oxycetoniae]|uniref:Major facilitator superfamily (MFS) profile domain-containing protein n=1 Tax=Candida oxycetoniae TaxID=497107 RepID=A0AAI9SU45_9ASCO|nr:uncharacterized protein KGF56_004386 [Candida oxycetoniae]KAI3402925.2 hypothetical protein KGF56_004386 [Candida oxycetoniae]
MGDKEIDSSHSNTADNTATSQTNTQQLHTTIEQSEIVEQHSAPFHHATIEQHSAPFHHATIEQSEIVEQDSAPFHLQSDHLESDHGSTIDSETSHQPPDPILGPLADLEKSITSFESFQQQELAKLQSVKSTKSILSKETLRVKRSEKRGILPSIVFIPEYKDAREYSVKIKYCIVTIISLASITGPMGTSIMLPAIDDIVVKLNTTTSMVNISVGIYLLSLGIFPLWWSSFSERIGRRTIYVISFVFFVAFSIGTALSPSIGALIVLRVLQGGSSASVQAVGAGTIADLFAPTERGVAMGWYYLGPLMGPFLAPVLGGAVSQAWGWRATQWLLMIVAACNLISILLFLPETLRCVDNIAMLRKIMQQQQQEQQNKEEEGEQLSPKQGDCTEKDRDYEEKENEKTDGSSNFSNHEDGVSGAHSQQPQAIIDERELERVATNLSRRSVTQSIRSYIEDDSDEGPIVDPVMPTLSRLTTNRSFYSRRVQSNYVSNEIRRSMSINQSDLQPKPECSKSSKSVPNTPPPSSSSSSPSSSFKGRKAEFKRNCYDLFIRPLHSLVLLKHPPVLLVIIYSAISFAVIYFFNMTISYEYSREPYHFSQVIVGLMYIPNSITYLAASMIGGRWNDHLLNKYAKKHGELVPEARISWNIVLAVFLYPMACLIFGWTIKYGEFWLVPLIGTAICGFASMLVIGATVTYLVDTLPGKGATGVALNNLIRQILAAIATFIVEPLLRAIGPGILFTILMGILTVASLILVYLKKKGAYFRENYDLMKLYEKL